MAQELEQLTDQEAMRLTDDALRSKDDKLPPLIPDPPDTAVRLPGGVVWKDEYITHAEVRELTGADEEALAKAIRKSTGAVGTMVKVLLSRAVVAIGQYSPPDNELLGSLLIGDRDALLLAIRRVTYGDELELTLTCPTCRAEMEATYNLVDDVPVKTLGPVDGPRVFDVELRRGSKARVVLPTGMDQEDALEDGSLSIPEVNTLMLAACIVDIDGEAIEGTEGARALGIQDRRKILTLLAEEQPGPRYQEVKQVCLKCEDEFPVGIDLPLLFLGNY